MRSRKQRKYKHSSTLFSQQPVTKPTIILLCDVYNDGIGDLQHLIDIYHFIKKNYTQYDIAVIIGYGSAETKRTIKNIVRELKINHLYLASDTFTVDPAEFIRNISGLDNLLKNASLAIQVSTDFIFGKALLEYVARTHPLNLLNCLEHESAIKIISTRFYHSIQLTMGLSPNHYGIKLALKEKADKITCLKSFSDALFIRALTGNSIPDDFFEHNIVIPAYINNKLILQRLLLILIHNRSLQNKNIVISVSSSKDDDVSTFINNIDNWIEQNNIGDNNKVEVLSRSNDEINQSTYAQHPEKATRTIRLINHFWLNNADYEKLFAISTFACVTGDNTLEKALNYKLLPFYFPTYPYIKITTFGGLCSAAMKVYSNKKSTLDAYQHFFESLYTSFFNTDNINDWEEKYRAHFDFLKTVNLIDMANELPTLCEYLHTHHNFYDALTRQLSNELSFTPSQLRPSGNI